MKKFPLYLYFILLTLYGCPNDVGFSDPGSGQCPEEPNNITLDDKNIQEITLSSEIITKSAIASHGEFIGYIFAAKEGQKLEVNTNKDVCLWIYAPNTELLSPTTTILPTTGKYIIQVSVPKGSKTFEITMGLDVVKASNSTSNNNSSSNGNNFLYSSKSDFDRENFQQNTSDKNPSNSQLSATKRSSPTQFVTNHYQTLNQRDYQTTWKSLSPNFQKIAGSFPEYVEWWDSVQEIRIGEVRLVNQNELQATVEADLHYIMKTGKSFKDQKNRIDLVWDDSSGNWKFYQKISPP